jgi:hypothetical protein
VAARRDAAAARSVRPSPSSGRASEEKESPGRAFHGRVPLPSPPLPRCPLIRIPLALAALVALAACSESVASGGPEGAAAAVRYVDPAAGSDARDGRSAQTAYRTIARALADVPSLVDTTWTVQLAAGEYAEGVRLLRFVMPSAVSYPQLRDGVVGRSIRLRGPAGALLAPTAPGEPCVTAAGVTLFLEGISCRVSGADGVNAAGSSLVLDDVRFSTPDSARSAVYLERSSAFLGGTLAVDGAFTAGMAIRSFSMARPGTHLHPGTLDARFTGVARGLFLRDEGSFTTAFDTTLLHFENVGTVAYAILGSRVFLAAGTRVRGDSVGSGFEAGHQSGINAQQVHLRGVAGPIVRCHKSSYVLIEQGTYEQVRGGTPDTDGSCQIRY